MASAAVARSAPSPSPAPSVRASSPSPSLRANSPPTPSRRASASPAPHHSPRASRRASFDKENVGGAFYSVMETAKHKILENGHGPLATNGHAGVNGHDDAAARPRRESSASEDDVDSSLRRRHGSVPRSPRAIPRSPPPGVATLPTIVAHVEMDTAAMTSDDTAHSPPPAPSAILAHSSADGQPPVGLRRRRRSSSVHAKPPPGVTPTKVVDWEIPRKVFHSSIGFITLALWFTNPPSVWPLIKYLSCALAFITVVDFFRLRYPLFADLWEVFVGFLMREEERGKINGVVWYLVGVIWVLSLYPREVAVVSIFILSWSDTTASTLGRLWGRYTPPLPPHFPGIKFLPFAPRKSLAGFLAATVTGIIISVSFWHTGSDEWQVLNYGFIGQALTALVVGLGGAVVEALDLGFDDNLTLPILSGALIWTWFSVTNFILGH